MTVRDVVVLGATGRYSPLVPALLAAGHRVRAGARDPEAAARQGLDAGGAEIVRVDFEDVATIAAAAHGADALFAAGTAHRAGPAGDTKHGRNIVDAARLADVGHLVYVSVAGADQPSEVPLFESKRHLEEYLFASGVPFTVIAPVYFMENLWNPWNLPVLAGGRFPSPIPAGRTLQQVPIETVVEFASHVIGRRDDFVGSRIEIASDELNALAAAEVVAGLVGRGLDVDDHVSGGPLPLFSWLDQVGYTIELGDLRTRFPDVAWRRFSEWAKTQDWSILASQPSPL